MSIENFTKIEPYKGIEKRNNGLQELFSKLKFNKKKAKYNYHSGLVAGMIVNNLAMLKPFVSSKESRDKTVVQKIIENILPMVRSLVESYNWKMDDLNNLTDEFFGDDE